MKTHTALRWLRRAGSTRSQQSSSFINATYRTSSPCTSPPHSLGPRPERARVRSYTTSGKVLLPRDPAAETTAISGHGVGTSNIFPVVRTWEQAHGGPRKGDKVVVAMSGGVDSSVTLRLLASSPSELSRLSLPLSSNSKLLESEYDLSAIFMRNWSRLESEEDHHSFEDDCEWEKDWEDVRRVCAQLGVKCEMIDLSHEYWLNVFEPAIGCWQSGTTPNPDVSCNREIKFGSLMDRALDLDPINSHGPPSRQWLATGHYAGTEWTSEGRVKLVRSSDETKDQTYYLSSVPEEKIQHAIFPLAGLRKTQVRELAKRWDLATATRAESMGVCFIGERGRFGKFISQYTDTSESPGDIITIEGKVVGRHQGLWYYTIGQKARLAGQDARYFVAKKDVERNQVVVVPGSDHPALYCTALKTAPDVDFHWIWPDHPPSAIDSPEGLRAKCQVRHRMQAVDVIVRRAQPQSLPASPLGSARSLTVEFPTDRPEKAVAPGQVVALWDEQNRWCFGSGVISSTKCLEGC